MRSLLWFCCIVWCGASVAAPARAQEPATVLAEHMAAAVADLPSPVRRAFEQIEGAPRRLLALRSYLRAGEHVLARWSWSDERIATFSRTREYSELVDSVEAVRGRFERQNPGYSLIANTQTRSLDLQLQRWNRNPGVAQVANALQRASLRELSRESYQPRATQASVRDFKKFLAGWRPPAAAPLAAPGMSLHGQARAIDFQVVKDGRIIAGPSIASVRDVWERQGWDRKLRAAVDERAFAGPLRSPNEPWHYEYVQSAERVAGAEASAPAERSGS